MLADQFYLIAHEDLLIVQRQHRELRTWLAFAWLTVVGGLGVLILMWSASAAVIAFFVRNPRRENAWRGLIAPAIAFLLLSSVLTATVIGFGDLLQVAPNSPFRWLIPAAYAAVALLGFGWGLITRLARAEVYAAIGRGTDGRLTAPSC